MSDMLRTLIASQTEDQSYLQEAVKPRQSSCASPSAEAAAIHPLLVDGEDTVAQEGQKLSLGNLQACTNPRLIRTEPEAISWQLADMYLS